MSLGTESKNQNFMQVLKVVEPPGSVFCQSRLRDYKFSFYTYCDTPEKTLQRVVQFYESCQKEFGQISGIRRLVVWACKHRY